ncbi:voltage gated chloride channel [Hesseltinella vesiculosa]|uniref:Chloride channel protein n=1 Tax=Hesseltinella vesiculosa TaxID=101127 RepID=A0A1X2GTY9_9FUNG|nr:voltage gated chloride channel [Hesseltinella vesiculosa]
MQPTNPQASSFRVQDELEEIGRYEDFSTIDWVKDATLERYRQSTTMGHHGQSQTWTEWAKWMFETFQSWIVVCLVGATIGFNSALIAIVTNWLSDIKIGYCSNAWWLNKKFCCWEIDEEHDICELWVPWSDALGLGRDTYIVNWFMYIVTATLFAATCAHMVKTFAPYAAGSGISEIKCIIAGFVMRGFLGGWTLVMKSIGLTMSVASNLSIGKEGPSVHMACCVGNVISRSFQKFRSSKAEMREILTASSAAGVAVAFGSPIGGVLFALEEMSTTFPNRTMWKSFFCAMIATIVLQAMNPFRTGKLVLFQVSYDREWHFFEYVFVIVIGVFGGLYGSVVIKYNLIVAQLRKRYIKDYPVLEATFLAFITAMIAYPNVFLRIDMTEIMGILFRECEGAEGEDYSGLCQINQVARLVFLLFMATIVRTLGTIVTYGARVPCGIFVPSMAIGATFGRMIGLIVKSWHLANPDFFLFSSCRPDMPCITPGTYAFLGAAAALCGVMRITVSVVVIMFELTGQITYILPTMITLMVTRAVADWFGSGGIAERYIRLNGYPFLDNDDHVFGVPVSHVMQNDMVVLTSDGMTLGAIDDMLRKTNFQGFPVVQDTQSMLLLGYIGRTELKYLTNRARKTNNANSNTLCHFRMDASDVEVVTQPPSADDSHVIFGSSESINLGPYIDQTPITVHPQLYLETVMDMFKQLGPRVILLEERGKLVGLVTVKDVLKYIVHMENAENSHEVDSPALGRIMAWVTQRTHSAENTYRRVNTRTSEEAIELQ